MFKDVGEYVDSLEFTVWKIKSVVIANKKAVQFQKSLTAKVTSNDKDSYGSSFIEPFQDIDTTDPDIIKIGPFCKSSP